jgi:hypothetical protein
MPSTVARYFIEHTLSGYVERAAGFHNPINSCADQRLAKTQNDECRHFNVEE